MRFVIYGKDEKDSDDNQLYWNNDDGWTDLQGATVFTDTLRSLPAGECYWVRLPEDPKQVVTSTDSNANWNDDLIQFSRFIAAMEFGRKLADIGEMREVLDSMDLSPESLTELIERAITYWDTIKEGTRLKRTKK